MCDHELLKSLSGGKCPLCSTAGSEPVKVDDLIVEQSDWRANPNVLAPLMIRLPSEGSDTPWPKVQKKEYRAPPVGFRAGVEGTLKLVKSQITKIEIEAERCRRSLAYFVRSYWPIMSPGITLHWNWHLEQICDHVQGLLEEWMLKQRDPSYEMKAQNLAINCPPRSLKSTIVSICAPAWMWLTWPSWKSIFVSANPKVAVRDARGCRSCIESNWYRLIRSTLGANFPEGSTERDHYDWELDGQGDLEYRTTKGGYRISMSFKSMGTGLGGDAIFVDDPNDAKRVYSEKNRADVNDTWDLALCNRVNDYMSSIRIMIMQRLHELDLTGHWRASMPTDRTVYLAIPLEFNRVLDIENEKSPFEFHDPRTDEGDNLHPARFDADTIRNERTRLGEYGFAGQMNQSPVPLEGGAFKRTCWNFFYVASLEQHHHALTGSIVDNEDDKPTFDYVDGNKIPMGKDSALSWQPIDARRTSLARPTGCDTTRPAIPLPFLDRLIISVDASFGSKKETASRVALVVIGMRGVDKFVIENRTKTRSVAETKDAIRQMVRDFPAVSTTLVERKASGDDVVKTLKSEISGMIPIDDNSSWIDRANGMLPSFLAGNWYILEGSQWATSIVSEFSLFPNGAHDDQIDVCSQASRYYFGSTGNNGPLAHDW